MSYEPVILKENLEHGKYYVGHCRNAQVARWNAEKELFYYWRYKFGTWFVESICCPEDDQIFDVFIAKEVIENPNKEIPFINEKEDI